ncbi:ADR080Wp [Eremothecium gossypii ATCC 10895]|uniref:ferric-chelate reductase (NADPH) n=1 Tax=Eremothecium gossypii (strain ATCC 10895 / CBS 109.51 / FGSC 9923 / NRRL Y-1056) TaxID=284811 RepID=Q75A39_EREGS|nr:ADR080Wp [Eremothecium gossypii ATCC 10895]AAS52000.1 ADR080Wp [Eremothecium gossypii ATCC 10895]
MKIPVVVLAYLPLVINALVIVDSALATACIYYDKTFNWGCGSTGNGQRAYACRCRNVNWLGTVTNCIVSNSDSKKVIEHALRHVSQRCKDRGNYNYSLEDMYGFYHNGTAFLRDPTPEDLKQTVNTTLRANPKEFSWYYTKFQLFNDSVRKSQWFGWILVFYWAAVVGFATLFNICDRVFGVRPMRWNWVKKHIALPSVFSDYHERTYFFCRILPLNFPTRLHGLIVTGFVALTVLLCCFDYNIKLPHPFTTSQWFMDLDLISYRVDLMAISLFPVIYFFGIRNNPFIPLSGMSFSTFNFYHKWTAYACFVLAAIHSLIWIVYSESKEGGGFKAWWGDAYFKWGLFATVLAGLLVLHSEKFIRQRTYEFFLILHKLFNIVFIVCMYMHIKTLGWHGWVWSMVAIYCFERVARIARIVLAGGIKKATLTDVGDRVLKMTVEKPKHFKYYPGAYVFVYFISGKDAWFYPFQSHPFTVLNTPKIDGDNLVIYFKVHKGVTQQLLNRIFLSGKESIEYKVLLEGPYGNTIPRLAAPDRRYVGASAGLGVAAVYPHFVSLLDKESQFTHSFYWIINDLSYLHWFSHELRYLADRNCDIKIIYTRSNESAKELTPDVADSASAKFVDSLDICRLLLRPDLKEIVEEQILLSSNQAQDVTFISSGPSTFNDHFRYAVKSSITGKLQCDVDLEEESYTW